MVSFRVGRHNNRTVYYQPDDDPKENDRLVCTTQTSEAAILVAGALNLLFEEHLPGITGRLVGFNISVDVSEPSEWKIAMENVANPTKGNQGG